MMNWNEHRFNFLEKARQQVAFYLEDINTPIGKTVNLTLTGLILISLTSFISHHPLTIKIKPDPPLRNFSFKLLILILEFG